MERFGEMKADDLFKKVCIAALMALCALSVPASKAETSNNLAEVAVQAGNFKSLVKALEASELVDALTQDTSYTVFAPTDDAFKKLPETLRLLVSTRKQGNNKTILLYHVVPGTPSAKKSPASGSSRHFR